jgi:hypothetical protein
MRVVGENNLEGNQSKTEESLSLRPPFVTPE